jgi:hypothetical protein
MAGLVPAISLSRALHPLERVPGTEASEATPFFEHRGERSDAVLRTQRRAKRRRSSNGYDRGMMQS